MKLTIVNASHDFAFSILTFSLLLFTNECGISSNNLYSDATYIVVNFNNSLIITHTGCVFPW